MTKELFMFDKIGKWTLRKWVEKLWTFIFAIACGIASEKFLPEKFDLFIPGIALAFLGGAVLVLVQKYIIIVLCGNWGIGKFLNGMRQTGSLRDFVSYCEAAEEWAIFLIAISLFAALEIMRIPALRFLLAFSLGGSISSFLLVNRLFAQMLDYALKNDD